MSTAIELAFVVAGLLALMWAIMFPRAHIVGRIAAGLFGVVVLAIAFILHGEDRERERW